MWRWMMGVFFVSSRRRHTRWPRDWSSDVCSSDLPDAAHMAGREVNYPALPRHILGPEFTPDNVEAFVNQPFWAREFVGLGPYRETSWEPGTFIEAAAFDGHAAGRPKIDRIRLVFIADRNTGVANVLTNEVHLTGPTVLGVEQAV